jgi:hypothetical protein
MHRQHLTTARTALIFNYSFNIDALGHIKTVLSINSGTISTSFWCLLPFTHAGLTLRFITHNVQNALTSSHCSQNYTAIHLFFHYWCFWTHQNDCIALTAMHSFCCVKPSTHTLALTTTMYRMHWHHPTAAKTTLPFIYSFTIDVFGHIKMIV